jgi:hypothetical protein
MRYPTYHRIGCSMTNNFRKEHYRKRNTRDQSRRILLIVDGRSEKKYFEYFKGKIPGVHVKIYVTKGDLKIGIRKAWHDILLCDPEKDFIALVTDVDAHSSEELINFEKQCEEHGIRTFISNPSFEVWLLMHFGNVRNGLCSQEDLESELSIKLNKPYVKAEGIEITNDRIKEAMKQAELKIKNSDDRTSECLSMPLSTTIHFLIE